jgi:hypothetical protein
MEKENDDDGDGAKAVDVGPVIRIGLPGACRQHARSLS